MLTISPWDFDWRAIETPVHIWQGEADTLVLPGLQRVFCQENPHLKLELFANEGHSVGIARQGELFRLFESDRF